MAPRVLIRTLPGIAKNIRCSAPSHRAPILVALDRAPRSPAPQPLIPPPDVIPDRTFAAEQRSPVPQPHQRSPKTTASPPPIGPIAHPDPRCPYARRRRQCRPRHPCRIHPARLKSNQRKLLCVVVRLPCSHLHRIFLPKVTTSAGALHDPLSREFHHQWINILMRRSLTIELTHEYTHSKMRTTAVPQHHWLQPAHDRASTDTDNQPRGTP
jgi:hypothetical protein